jgi:hypothetical protein
MAHFAQLDENNVVMNVIRVADHVILDENGNESEEIGINYLKSIISGNYKWVQTSYNDNIRYRYAHIGGIYDEESDAFYFKKPYPSWTINRDEFGWDPPSPKPEEQEGYVIQWNEDNVSWEYIKLPEPMPTDPPQEGYHYVYDEENDVWNEVENAPMPTEPAPEGQQYVYDPITDTWNLEDIPS